MSAEIGSGFGYKVSVAYLIIMRKNLLNMIKKYQYPLEKYTKLVYIIFELENKVAGFRYFGSYSEVI